ncbi:molecular chaperone GrpE [Streptomonospora sp. S1-112]|uniref:Molecular chaperone GrpE n=1 Tax=Streptomonospora mangrovi TaxID=2883123 RepID=A0A9X3NKB7_9ACTN|nr:molecular chaperone GrpE [Streptomonospora mangrovi]MDA0563703.1 molecular chaperone GrpE [Streptomonospora mangrovi]
MDAKTRKSVPVRAESARVANSLRRPGSPERRALLRMGVSLPEGEVSESAALAALVEAGRAALADELLADEYAAMAVERTDEDSAARAAMRGRVSRRAD